MARSPANKKIRPTLLDLIVESDRNLLCARADLSNEASVETFFVNRLLSDVLGYSDSQIQTKQTLERLTVGRGHRRERYRPDYALKVKKRIRCIIDAKGTDESIDDWIEQCSGYCLALNRKYPGNENPVSFFMLTNGLETKVYRWDSDAPLIEMSFADFEFGRPKFEQLRSILAADKIATTKDLPPESKASFEFRRPTSEHARHIFAACHNAIRKSGYGPGPAFLQFVKIMFVKLAEDKKLRENPATTEIIASGAETVKLPAIAVRFSLRWIAEREAEGSASPLDSIIFERLRSDIETDIYLKKKKRLFNSGERIDLRPDVIKTVVQKLEHLDMFGIDEDLNGRLFETFLNATMRGRELGQFFTPRSVVKMMTRLADLRADSEHQDKVIDGCCGSGGFLIEALTIMRNQIRDNVSIPENEKRNLIEEVCNNCFFGIDFGKDPPLARIARINMYLHGDGGSRIYATDGLDKNPHSSQETDSESVSNIAELRSLLSKPTLFDAVLTNPPFSMTKEAKNDTDLQVLLQYKLARKKPGAAEIRPSLRSSVMYLERYYDLLRPGGKFITVIDDTLLASKDFAYVRDYIRDHFLVRAIISLPGDTFRRSGSRVKTSVLYLEKKQKADDIQPSCFAYFSEYLGVDDLVPRASAEDINQARSLAERETEEILSGYKKYLRGEKGSLVLSPSRITTRLDLKYCVPLFGRMADKWRKSGIDVKPLSECVKLIEDVVEPSKQPDENFTLIKVTYDGVCQPERIKKGKAIKPKTMYRVRKGQMVFSVIRSTDGAIGIVPDELDGALVSDTSYVVFECPNATDAAYLWAVLRSHEIRADMQSLSPGSSRYTTPWPEVGEVLVPWLSDEKRRGVGQGLIDTWALEKQVEQRRTAAMAKIDELGVESNESIQRWRASKAPQ
jgi:type I restriction enzyme M protein